MRTKPFIPLSLLVAFFLFTNPLKGKEEEKEPKNPLIEIKNRYKKKFINKERYELPSTLTNEDEAFFTLSDQEKEKKLIEWFKEKEKKDLSQIAYNELLYYGAILLAGIPIFLLLFGTNYFLVMNSLFTFIKNFLSGNGKVDFENLEARASIMGHLKGASQWILGKPNAESENESHKINGFVNYVSLYYLFQFFQVPANWLWNQLHYTWMVYNFMKNPLYENPVKKIEYKYIRSIYLFNEAQRNFIEELLLSAYEEESNLNDIETFIQMQRALPKGVKKIVYDQEAIDLAFAEYTPELKALAENIIALLVIYTKAIQSGKKELLKILPISSLLFYGPPGTGKSNLPNLISHITGLNLTKLTFEETLLVTFKGENGRKNWLGTPSAYMKALSNSVDKFGRNYENNIMIIEGMGAYFDDKMTMNYLKIFLDPRNTEIKDPYMRTTIDKLPIIFVTSNKLPHDPALLDRFMIFEFKKINRDKKKNIIDKNLVPLWVNLLSDKDLQTQYQEPLNKNKVTKYLKKELSSYIDQEEKEERKKNHKEKDPQKEGMRGCEGELLQKSMMLIKKNIQKN